VIEHVRQDPEGSPAETQVSPDALLDLAYDAIFVRDFHTDEITLWNRAAEDLYGYSRDEAIGRSAHDLLHTEFPVTLDEIRRTIDRAGHWEGRLVHHTKDGRTLLVSSRWAARGTNLPTTAVLEINTDITDRTRSDEQGALLAAIVQSSTDTIFSKTLDGTITSWNRAAERMYGYMAEEVIGKPVTILVPHDLPDEVPQILARVARGERIEHYETRRLRKDGSELNVSISVSPIRNTDREIIGAATIARDITEQVRMEAERGRLLEGERRARNAAEWAKERLSFIAAASAVLGTSLDVESTLTNLAWLAVPKVADFCTVLIADEHGVLRRLVAAHVDPDRIALAEELERRYPPTPDSGTYRILTTGEPDMVESITDQMLERSARDPEHLQLMRQLQIGSYISAPLVARGRILGVISLVMAESGRHYSSEDLSLVMDLARRAGTAVDNARLYTEAQEALRLREEFLSIASHELRTPLTALQLQVQLLRRQAGANGSIPADLSSHILEGIERQVKRLGRLTNDLLDVSRIAAGRFELDTSQFDLGILVDEVVARFEDEVSAAGSSVEVRHAAPAPGRWDRHRLDQVLANLLSNAVKYGSGRPIRIHVDADATTAYLRVSDGGPGIAKENLIRIFDRFERVETVSRTAGLGLGLFIARQIVEAHGGTIRAESVPDTGSTFVVELPR
jgi:PAS domain S-box-containing protein